MFTHFLFALRGQGLKVGTGEWLVFLDALKRGLAGDLDQLYALGRALLCKSEIEYDAYDLAFAATFSEAALPPELLQKLTELLNALAERPEGDWVEHGFESLEDLWKAFQERLREQREQHDGGNRWIGTQGTSPFGNSGRAKDGIRVEGGGGGRQAVAVAMDRKWENYRSDRTLDVRDLKIALRELRNLVREGAWELDLDGTIDQTAKNAGDIQIVEERERKNQVHVVLLMDAGGSMAPHYEKVSALFSAAEQLNCFKSFKHYSFHNCVYNWLYEDYEQLERVPTSHVLENLTPKHRLIFVGDASMAPYELFNPFGWPHEGHLAGLDWLQRFRSRCRASVWLNPDPERYWDHPTVRAIGQTFPMYPLTLEGLRDAVKKLRAPV
ncbi:MAG: VWA containing CoxE family protein [Myxococcales bacterium]|nr:VWA containing CoxE family protein [Myxococcales bacterium]MCB9670398.1 VWA containing CoxE family protein [Alphaproteobacteria bacterium]